MGNEEKSLPECILGEGMLVLRLDQWLKNENRGPITEQEILEIIRRVNSHDRMVNSINEMHDWICANVDASDPHFPTFVLDRADRALAKV